MFAIKTTPFRKRRTSEQVPTYARNEEPVRSSRERASRARIFTREWKKAHRGNCRISRQTGSKTFTFLTHTEQTMLVVSKKFGFFCFFLFKRDDLQEHTLVLITVATLSPYVLRAIRPNSKTDNSNLSYGILSRAVWFLGVCGWVAILNRFARR